MKRSFLTTWMAALALGCGGGDAGQASAGASAPEATPAAELSPPAKPDARGVVLFFGNSLTAGLGVEPEQAFPALIGQKIDSAGLPFRVVNAGVSGETTADGLRRIDWVLQQPVAAMVLELGANDGLRGQDPDAMKRNLLEIVRRARARYPGLPVVLAGMQAPPNLGPAYTTRFRQVFPEVAKETGAALVPFLLQDVAGIPRLNQADRIHPTPEGHRIVAGTVWRTLQPVLRQLATGKAATAKPAA